MSLLEEIITMAIAHEDEAIESYTEILKVLESKPSRDIVHNIIDYEKKHKKELEQIISEGNFPEINQNQKNALEKNALNSHTKLNQNSSPVEILEYAIIKEQKSENLYLTIAETYKSNMDAKNLFLKLAHDENQHQKDLEKIVKILK